MMRINCRSEDLSSGVQTIQAALSARTTLPILLNFLLETENTKIKLVSTDLQMGVKHYIKAEVESGGSITIPAKKFADILHTLPAEKDILLSMDDEGRVQVRCGRSRFIINGTPKSEYPVLPEFKREAAFEVAATELAKMIRKTIFAASTDETRYVLNGVFWAASKGQLEMVATDGRRLARARAKLLPGEQSFRVIIPTKVLGELGRLLAEAEGTEDKLLVGITDNQVAFQFKSTTMLSRLVDGSFPNYEQVIPVKRDISVAFPVKDFMTITKQAALCTAERGGSVKLTLRKGALQVLASSQTLEFEDELPAEYKGEDFVVAFNPQYVLEGLKAIPGERVVLSLTTPVNPALFEPEGEEEYQYVVMPMRV